MARPRVEDRSKHLYGVNVRLKKEEYDMLFELSKAKDKSMSAYIRDLIILKHREYEYRKKYAEL